MKRAVDCLPALHLVVGDDPLLVDHGGDFVEPDGRRVDALNDLPKDEEWKDCCRRVSNVDFIM